MTVNQWMTIFFIYRYSGWYGFGKKRDGWWIGFNRWHIETGITSNRISMWIQTACSCAPNGTLFPIQSSMGPGQLHYIGNRLPYGTRPIKMKCIIKTIYKKSLYPVQKYGGCAACDYNADLQDQLDIRPRFSKSGVSNLYSSTPQCPGQPRRDRTPWWEGRNHSLKKPVPKLSLYFFPLVLSSLMLAFLNRYN